MAQPASVTSSFLPGVSLEQRSVVPSGVPLCASAPPVRGYLRIEAHTRKPFFRETSSFFQELYFYSKNRGLVANYFANPIFGAIILPVKMPDFGPETGIPRESARFSPGFTREIPGFRFRMPSAQGRFHAGRDESDASPPEKWANRPAPGGNRCRDCYTGAKKRLALACKARSTPARRTDHKRRGQ